MFILPVSPVEVKPAVVRTLTDAEFKSWLRGQAATLDADEYRPSAGPDFTPTADEEAEAVELLNGDVEPDWDGLADDATALDAVCSGRPWM